MTQQDPQSVEAMLARYRPAQAPEQLLCRVEQAALHSRTERRNPLTAALSGAAEFVLGLAARALAPVAIALVLLLLSTKGY